MLDSRFGVVQCLGVLAIAAGCAVTHAARPAAHTGPKAAAKEPVHRVERVAQPPAFEDPDRRAKLEAAIPAIDAYLQGTVERDGLVGLAAGIVIDDALVWSRGYGLRDPSGGLPVESDTAFGIGSITKPITAFAVLLLRDRGLLGLDRPAHESLPALAGLVYPSADSPPVTIRHLLTHRSGLPRMGDFPEYPSAPMSRTELVAALDGLRLDHPPGVAHLYSNLGVQILGPLIDDVAQEDHRVFIRREILEPIGMAGAGWTPQEVGERRLAMPHELDEHGAPRRRPHWTPGAADAAGGLYASVDDLAAFAAFNLGAWPPGGSHRAGPLRAATVREAHAMGVMRSFRAGNGEPATARVSGYGLGFAVYSTCRYPHVVAHGGKTLGHRATLHMLPRHGVAVILLTNLSSIHSSVLPRDAEAVLNLLHDTGALKPRVPFPAPGLPEGVTALGRLLGRWTTEAYERTFSADFRDAAREPSLAERFGRWHGLLGECARASVLEVSDTYAGAVELACERGALRVNVRVAPWDGHPITSMRIVGATGLEPPPSVLDAAKRATARLDRHCELADPRFVELDGATFALQCTQGPATMRLTLDPAGEIEHLEVREDVGGPCR